MNNMHRFCTAAGWLAVLYVAVLFCYPLSKVLISSFADGDGYSLANYMRIFTSPVYGRIFTQTVWVSLVSTAITLVIGYSLAYFIANRPAKTQGVWLISVIMPMCMSLTIRFFGWMIFLGKEGPLALLIRTLTGTSQEMTILFSMAAVILGIVHYALPFVTLNIYASLKRLDPALLEAAQILGASRHQTFWRVIFPLSLPGVFSAGSIAFSIAASTFLVPRMLGGPKDMLLANMAYDAIVKIGAPSLGAALSMVLLAMVVVVLLILNRLERRSHFAD